MITANLLALIRRSLRDPNSEIYTDDNIYDALADTQLELGLTLPVEMLGELTTNGGTVTSITAGVGTLPTGALGSYERAVIRAYDGTDGKWMTKIVDPVTLNNSYSPTAYDPIFWISGTKIYMRPTTIAAATVDFLATPSAIASGVDPTINAGLHYLLATGAEYRVRGTLDRDNNLTAIVRDEYYKSLNELIKPKKAGK